ncbi:MAG: 4Fe-4S dicluster domain-containing protein [Ignavibacteriales bacterium]|nr:MAG: 4Fe-4S dicluster domain-containing protein [Ignavibacteriales bacterium]
MNLSVFKKVRVVVSLFFFVVLTYIFIDFRTNIPSQFINGITFLQFIPSVLKFIAVLSLSAGGFLLILVLTFLFGRVYCSSICPLGTLQDFISRFAKKANKKKRYKFSVPHNVYRYSFLSVFLLSYLAGSIYIVNLLDPYSNFGKIISNIFRPVYIASNNSVVWLLEKMDLYWLYPYDFRGLPYLSLIFSFSFLVIIIILSYRNGRLYCNSVCPVGTILGLISKYSVYKIKIDADNCKGCGVCERVCKAKCIDMNKEDRKVDSSRCVACFNCFDVCPTSGIHYTRDKKKKNLATRNVDESKRNFIVSSFIYLIGLASASVAQVKVIPKKLSKIPINKKNPVSPPGSKSIEFFTDRCTACHLCITACPTQVLQPSYLHYGFLGMMQPTMDYNKSFCNFECIICTEVCPTGALLPLKPEDKKLVQIGKVNFIKDNCIVHTENTECGACSEHCPTKAVSMVPFKNLLEPKTNPDICIGCGACEYACPVKPYKAIYVDGNAVHLKAQKPKVEKLEQKVNYEEDFPF